MKVSDILRVKGSTLYTVQPDQPLAEAAGTMACLLYTSDAADE